MTFKQTLKTYYAFSKTGIVYSNVIAAAAGLLFARGEGWSWTIAIGLLVGMLFFIAGACAANNCLDRGIDTAMQRTKKRGLVTGALQFKHGLIYAITMSIIGLLILIATQNKLTVLLGVVAYIDYVILYGWAKRTTTLSTLIGAVSGSLPLVMGYTALSGRFDAAAWLLFALMGAWQMGHFLGIAMQRKKDYAAAKLPVVAVVKSEEHVKRLVLLYVALYAAVCVVFVVTVSFWLPAAVLLIGSGVFWFWGAVSRYTTLNSVAWGKYVFLRSLLVLLFLCLAVALRSV